VEDDTLTVYLRLKISSVLWFYPTVTRKQGEAMLDGKDPGTFLARNSRQVGHFAVSVCSPTGEEPAIQHYLIKKDPAGFTFDQAQRFFIDLESLVAHYVTNLSDGMPCLLKLPALITRPASKSELTLVVNREAGVYNVKINNVNHLIIKHFDRTEAEVILLVILLLVCDN
jgi:hypothetical protein